MWRASLLDPEDYPMPEASGSAMFTYGLAWGVNQGLLDRAKFEPAVRKAWPALVGCVDADGKLTHIQPAGDHPVKFDADSTQPYGGGVFLLAGSEVYRMTAFEGFQKTGQLWSKLQIPSAFRRDCETVELNLASARFYNQMDLHNTFPSISCGVLDGLCSRILDSQAYASKPNICPDKLLFQVDLAPGETRTFYILDVAAFTAVAAAHREDLRALCAGALSTISRGKATASRIASTARRSSRREGTISSGPDVWIKTYRNLMVNEMYASGHYHMDNGDEMDDFRVGNSRGCGGLGIWDGTKLHVSSNYHNWKLITTGPIRSEFELTYDAWDAGNGRMVSETKRYQH